MKRVIVAGLLAAGSAAVSGLVLRAVAYRAAGRAFARQVEAAFAGLKF